QHCLSLSSISAQYKGPTDAWRVSTSCCFRTPKPLDDDGEPLPLPRATRLPIFVSHLCFAAGAGLTDKEQGPIEKCNCALVCPVPCLFPVQNNDL
ncbi:hypothetical protein P7K49_034039, partial [Saguinus oedipus]